MSLVMQQMGNRIYQGVARCLSTAQMMPRQADRDELVQLRRRIMQLETAVLDLRGQLQTERKLANVDALTGIPNRRAYDRRLQEEIARSERQGYAFSMVVWDIDHFKQINDRHGHAVGDQVIVSIAGILEARMRCSDFTARFGGEEFVSLLCDCDEQGAMPLVESLREEIARHPIRIKQGAVSVTISCGIARFAGDESGSALLSRADAALYRAKTGGRNQVCRAA